jgi:hypothetical protein
VSETPRNLVTEPWRWAEGEVDTTRDHLRLYYKDDEQPVVLVGPPDDHVFPVAFLIEDSDADAHAQERLRAVRKELDFYLLDVGRPNPWRYAIYHSGTSSNLYSAIHWVFSPLASIGGEQTEPGPAKTIPDGLTRCAVCGELEGEFLYKGPHDPKPTLASVRCLCDGLVCGNCGQERMHRPISDYYNEEDGRVWHVPAFMALRKCRVCGAQDWVREYDEARADRKHEARLAAARQHVVPDYTEDLGASAERGGVLLYAGTLHSGITSHAEAYVDGAGDLGVETQDLGKDLERRFGDSDYEWWVIVRAANKPKMLELLQERQHNTPATVPAGNDDSALLSLIERTFAGPSASTDLQDWLTENGIAFETSTYV